MILELKNIDKSFGEKEVLKGVSFVAEEFLKAGIPLSALKTFSSSVQNL